MIEHYEISYLVMKSKQFSCGGFALGNWSVTAECKSFGGDEEAALNGTCSGRQTALRSLQQLLSFSQAEDLSEQLLHSSHL